VYPRDRPCGMEERKISLPRIEPQLLSRLPRSGVAIPTELYYAPLSPTSGQYKRTDGIAEMKFVVSLSNCITGILGSSVSIVFRLEARHVFLRCLLKISPGFHQYRR
jgi:hypothetical protein